MGQKLWVDAKLLEDALQELYLRCKKYSKLFEIVRLLHVKTKNHLTMKTFKEVLGLIKDALPQPGDPP